MTEAAPQNSEPTEAAPAKPSIWQGNAVYLLAITVFALSCHLAFGAAWPGELIRGFYTDSMTYMLRVTDTEWWSDRGQFTAYNAPFGTVLHWTFPLPALITALAMPMSLIMPWHDALEVAGSLTPFLCMLAVAFGVYRLGQYLTTNGWAAISSILALSCFPIFDYSQFGRPDHHMLALASVVWFWVALTGMELGQRRPTYGIFAGLIAALALWTTPETMPGLVVGLALQLWYRLCLSLDQRIEPDHRRTLISDACLAATWISGLLLALIIDPPFEGRWAAAFDRLSIVHLTFASCTSLLLIARTPVIATVSGEEPSQQFVKRLAAITVLGLTAVGLFLISFPTAPAGAMNHVSPDMEAWLSGIQEMQPISEIDALIEKLSAPLFGLIAMVLLYEDQRDPTDPITSTIRRYLMLGALGACSLLLVVGIVHFRFSYYAIAAIGPFIFYLPKKLAATAGPLLQPDKVVTAMLVTPLVTGWIADGLTERGDPRYNLFGRNAEELALAANGELDAFYANNDGWPVRPATFPMGQAHCSTFPMVDQMAELLMPELDKAEAPARPIAMFPQNPSPALAYIAGLNIVAAPYHRNDDGILDSFTFYTAPEFNDLPAALLEERNVDVVGVCIKPVIDDPDLERPAVYDWALAGGDDDYGPALIIPGRWVILARRDLLGDWAPVFFVDERDQEDADTGDNRQIN